MAVIIGDNSANILTGDGSNDTIDGMGGNDTLTGGGGNDVFRYSTREFNNDIVTDFTATGTGADKIDLSALNIGDFSTLSRFISQDSLGNAVITFGFDSASESITLKGISKASLTAANFIFNTDSAALTVEGTSYSDVIFGGNGSDTLTGYNGTDTLSGGAGNDILNGGRGNDILIGGAGNDVFIYTEREFNNDTIEDFTISGDKLNLSFLNLADFATLSRFITQDSLGNAVITLGFDSASESITLKGVSKASLTAANFIFNTDSAALTVEGTSYSDVIFGGNGSDTLYGYNGADTLSGGAGNDILNAGSGNDTMVGGAGNDIYRYTAREFNNDTIVDFATNGDRIDLSFLNVADFATLSRFVIQDSLGNAVIKLGYDSASESITLKGVSKASLTAANFIFNTSSAALTVEGTSYSDVIFGGNGSDTLTGYNGNDTLSGGAGNDILNGGSGNDTMVGGAGNDIYRYTAREFNNDTIVDFATSGDRIDLSFLNVADFATLSRFVIQDSLGNAVIKLGYDSASEAIILKGISKASLTAANFIFNTNSAALTVEGTSYSDVIFGGNGSDTLYGYSGADTLSGGAGNDTLNAGSGNDTLIGGTGGDRMVGGEGSDFYYVDNTADVVIEATGEGVDTVFSTINFAAGAQYIENITLTGSANINATGNGLANTLVGNSASNILNGGAGADTMSGGAGSDSYYVENLGDKVIEGNVAGVDKVYSSVSYSISGQFIENLTLTGTGNINGTGNSMANIIAGNAGSNIINGGLGVDTMAGLAGNDSYYVDNAGDKVIEGNVAGIDKVYSSVSYSISGQFIENLTLTGTANINGTGNSLANAIAGNAGSNIINGGLGNDTLLGGAGADRFVFNTALGNSNVDKITDFNVPQDAIWLDNAVFTALGANGLLSAEQFHVGTGAHDANDRIIYNSASGALFYDSNGSAAGGSVQFATLNKGLAMTNADFLII